MESEQLPQSALQPSIKISCKDELDDEELIKLLELELLELELLELELLELELELLDSSSCARAPGFGLGCLGLNDAIAAPRWPANRPYTRISAGSISIEFNLQHDDAPPNSLRQP